MSDAVPPALFLTSGDRIFVPTAFTRGPWRPDAQHGGPPAALLLHLAEQVVEEGEFLAHVEVELLRPVPLTPLEGTVERQTVSRRVHRAIAGLRAEGELVARANALLLTRTDLPSPQWKPDAAPSSSPPPETAEVQAPRWASGDQTTYHRNAVEHRFTSGTFREPGPAVDWQRLRFPVVEGVPTTGWQRVAASADFGSGITAVYSLDSGVGLINANLTIALARMPQGEWISIDAQTHLGDQGTGLAVTHLGDRSGSVGVATQSLLGYRMR